MRYEMKDDSKYLVCDVFEKIYNARDGEDISDSITNFFAEIMKRKRDDDYSGGLLAAAVIFKDCYAAKINEENGTTSHLSSHVNLIRYLRNKKGFITVDGTKYSKYVIPEEIKLVRNGIDVRIICSARELTILINTYIGIQSEFERDVLKAFTKCLDEYFKANIIDNIIYQVSIASNCFGCMEWNYDSYSSVNQFLDEGKIRSRRKK